MSTDRTGRRSRGDEPGLFDIARELRFRWKLVAAIVVALAGVALVVSLLETPVYVATAEVSYSRYPDIRGLVYGEQYDSFQRTEVLQSTVASVGGEEITTAVNDAVARRFGDVQGLGLSAELVVIDRLRGTSLYVPSSFTVTARASDPEAAAFAADRAAQAIVDASEAEAARTLEAGIKVAEADLKEVRAELRQLRDDEESPLATFMAEDLEAQRDNLRQRLGRMRALAESSSSNLTLSRAAAPPARPVSPNTTRNVALAAGSGLVLALAIVVLISLSRYAHLGVRHVRAAFPGVPVFGVLGGSKDGGEQLSAAADNLLYATALRDTSHLAIAVDRLGDAAQTASSGLVSALREAGADVTMITVEDARAAVAKDGGTVWSTRGDAQSAPDAGGADADADPPPHDRLLALGPVPLHGDPGAVRLLRDADALVLVLDLSSLDVASVRGLADRLDLVPAPLLGLIVSRR